MTALKLGLLLTEGSYILRSQVEGGEKEKSLLNGSVVLRLVVKPDHIWTNSFLPEGLPLKAFKKVLFL